MPLPLFDPPPSVIELRDQAMAQVRMHAEQHQPRFVELAMDFVLRYLREHGPTSGEVLTLACKRAGVRPHDDRAFGSVYLQLARAGVITKVGTCPRKRGNLTAGGNIWALMKS